METQLVLESELINILQNKYPEILSKSLNSGNLMLWKLDTTIPYGLIIIDQNIVFIVAYTETGELKGVISNDSHTIVEWANGEFEKRRNKAKEITSKTVEKST